MTQYIFSFVRKDSSTRTGEFECDAALNDYGCGEIHGLPIPIYANLLGAVYEMAQDPRECYWELAGYSHPYWVEEAGTEQRVYANVCGVSLNPALPYDQAL